MSKNKKEKSPTRLFVKVLVLAVVIGLVLCGIGFSMLMGRNEAGHINKEEGSVSKNPISFVAELINKENDFNMAFFGVDKGGTRTDVIFVIHFDAKENAVSMLSIPRDTRVEICDEAAALIKEQGYYAPYECKLNEVHSYGREKGVECSILQIEDLLGIDINYYGKINLEGFVELVDEIGGVDIEVPSDMYYVDDVQGLYINLSSGKQHLDGKQSEQLVRFRSYPLGDVQRVEVQKLFLRELANKVLDPATIKANISGYIKIFTEYVETDFSLSSLMKYSDNFSKISSEDILMETLPGAGAYVGDVSYYLVDEDSAYEVIQKVFYPKSEKDKSDSRNYRIEVSNGGEKNGYAAQWRDKLTEDGFNIVNITTYQGEKAPNTRIIVSESGMGIDLLSYFKGASVIEDVSMLNRGTDIRIILGMEE